MAGEREDTGQDAATQASQTDVDKGAREIGDAVGGFITDQVDQTKEAVQFVGDQLGEVGQWAGRRIEGVSPYLPAAAKRLAATALLMQGWQSGEIRNPEGFWVSILKLFADEKTNLEERSALGDPAAPRQLEQLESGITTAKKNLAKEQGTGGQTRMDALPPDQEVATEQVAEDTARPTLASYTPGRGLVRQQSGLIEPPMTTQVNGTEVLAWTDASLPPSVVSNNFGLLRTGGNYDGEMPASGMDKGKSGVREVVHENGKARLKAGSSGMFVVYENFTAGVAPVPNNLHSYRDRKGIKTVKGISYEWTATDQDARHKYALNALTATNSCSGQDCEGFDANNLRQQFVITLAWGASEAGGGGLLEYMEMHGDEKFAEGIKNGMALATKAGQARTADSPPIWQDSELEDFFSKVSFERAESENGVYVTMPTLDGTGTLRLLWKAGSVTLAPREVAD